MWHVISTSRHGQPLSRVSPKPLNAPNSFRVHTSFGVFLRGRSRTQRLKGGLELRLRAQILAKALQTAEDCGGEDHKSSAYAIYKANVMDHDTCQSYTMYQWVDD